MHVFALVTLSALAVPPVQDEPDASPTDVFRREAEALETFVESELGARFLTAARDLPAIVEPRVVLWNRATGEALTREAAAGRGAEELEGFQERTFDATSYYTTFYGTPLAYARALDLAGQHGLGSVDGARVFDFGYGGIGHLRILASLGAHAAGVEVLELLKVLYGAPGDTGEVPRAATAGDGEPGRLELFHGSFPGDGELARAIGGGYRLVVSKNVLKRGYVHPEREAEPRMLVHLGVSDEEFVRAVFGMLEPGGLFVVYNLYPPQNPPEERYLPWATGGCPFERELVEEVGFEVVLYDRDDTPAAREMAHRLGWDRPDSPSSMELDTLFGMVTLLRRPR